MIHVVEHTLKSTSAHLLQKITTTVITVSLTLLASTNFSHSSSFTITLSPLTPSPFPDHQRLYHLPFIPSILAPCPLTSCKQHTSIILFFSILHQLLSPFHTSFLNSLAKPAPQRTHQASPHISTYASMLQDVEFHLNFYGRQVPPIPNFGLVGAHTNLLP